MTALVRERQAFDPGSSDRAFKVMASEYLRRMVYLSATKVMLRMAPKVQLALLTYDTKRAWPALESDEAEILIASERLTPRDARACTLHKEGFVVAQRHGHPRSQGKLTPDRFCALDHIVVSPAGGGFIGATDEALLTLGRQRHVATT